MLILVAVNLIEQKISLRVTKVWVWLGGHFLAHCAGNMPNFGQHFAQHFITGATFWETFFKRAALLSTFLVEEFLAFFNLEFLVCFFLT